ncbi:MAG: F0F1 ATP synthase subunit gamma [Rickettsiales bacterium]|jgi:F-type H+-transporting ATPase subunit gamma|nr:F0F1 ATP synthase subunit gamma [Rickettsiales bacterium]
MENLNVLKNELKATIELKELVSTMKTLAATNIKIYEKIASNLMKYQSNVDLGLQAILKQNPDILNHVSYGENYQKKNRQNGSREKIMTMVLGSNQGLCGRFNDRMVDFFLENSKIDEDSYIVAIGDRVDTLLASKKIRIDKHFAAPNSSKQIIWLVYDIFNLIERILLEEGLAKVSVYFTSYNSTKNESSIVRKRIFPLEKKNFYSLGNKKWPTNNIPYWRIGSDKLISGFIQQYIFLGIYMAIVNSMAAEQLSRLVTLQNAEKNIRDYKAEISLKLNQTRQNIITAELLDSISGIKSLHKNSYNTNL